MWVTCAVCGRQYVDDDYITDTRTYNICHECYKRGYRIRLSVSNSTKADIPSSPTPNGEGE